MVLVVNYSQWFIMTTITITVTMDITMVIMTITTIAMLTWRVYLVTSAMVQDERGEGNFYLILNMYRISLNKKTLGFYFLQQVCGLGLYLRQGYKQGRVLLILCTHTT